MVEDKFEVIKKGGTTYYKKNKWWHREDGPAIEYENGDQEWFYNGKRHREDGPAIEYNDGYKEWYYKGLFITNESQLKFEKILKLKAFM